MVVGAIGTVVRIGIVAVRIARSTSVFPKTRRVLREQGIFQGAQHGAGLGAFVASVNDYYEQEGRIDGIPSRQIKQRQYNRFPKTRGKVFKSRAGGRCRPFRNNRYR